MTLTAAELTAVVARWRARAHWNQNIGALACAGVGTYGSGGPLWSHSKGVVCFTDAAELLAESQRAARSVPAACGKGHPLAPENLHLRDGDGGRWRCRQCGRDRAAAFRGRRKTARVRDGHDVCGADPSLLT
jgi:hypothetical protein